MKFIAISASILFLIVTVMSTSSAAATSNVPMKQPTALSCQGTVVWQNPEFSKLTQNGIGLDTRLMKGYTETYNTNTTVPAGTYTAKVQSWDGYTGRHNGVQLNERYRVVLTSNNGGVQYESKYTRDLADPTDNDGAQNVTKLSEFTITKNAKLSFEHIGAGDSPGSVIPTGVCFERVIEVCPHNAKLNVEDANCKPKCQYNDQIFADNANCKQTCVHNSEIFADNTNCQATCEHNDALLANDVNCKPECAHNPELFSDDSNCKPSCTHNNALYADDANCKEICKHDATKFADDATCEPKITVVESTKDPVVTKLPKTGAGSVALLATAVSTSAGAAHAAGRKLLRR